MSKYKYKFGVATNKVGSETSDEIDLVDDWGYDEAELDEMSDSEFSSEMTRLVSEYSTNAVEEWATPLEDSRDW